MTIHNNILTVTISRLGAELKSIKNKSNYEYLWQADPVFWNRTSPILFPIVGALKNNTYNYNQKTYTLPRHGFARDTNFKSTQLSNTEALFTLTATPETLEAYPFNFKLQICYKLKGSLLHCTYTVFNLGNINMPFSIGGHPAFALKDENISNYSLEFNEDCILNCLELTSDGLISSSKKSISLVNQQLTLDKELFNKDALVFRDLKSNQIALKNKTNTQGIIMTFNDFSHFGIWSAPNAPFICLEPWCGIADVENHTQNIEDKEGIINLQPKTSIKKSWQIEIL